MKRVVVGTAGHIDHGKTSLVRTLTGIDTDRLPQEKERGITIEPGYAGMMLDGYQVSFVDVPGHEKFVRNMLAGAGGIEGVLLVVAADESVMPQTEEHLEICRLLGVRHAVVALTKTDAAASDLREIAELEITERVAGIFTEEPSVVPVSAMSGDGIDALRAAISEMASRIVDGRDERRAARIFRLPIDRIFGIRGRGTVVTGTTIGGSLEVEETVEILPERLTTRVRALQVHHEKRDRVEAGERASMNLADIDTNEIERGSVAVRPGVLEPTRVITCRVRSLREASLEDGQRLHLHVHSGSTTARLRLLGPAREGGTVEPLWAQLHLDAEVVVVAGDRFVLRSWSPMHTVGGGVVIDPAIRPLSRKTRSAWLEPLDDGSVGSRLVWMAKEAGPGGVTLAELVTRTGLEPEYLARAIEPAPSELVAVGERKWLHRDVITESRRRAIDLLSKWFEQNPVSTGMPRQEFVQKLLGDAPLVVVDLILEDLRSEEIAEARKKVIDVPGRDGRPAGEMGELTSRIEEIFRRSGLEPPSLREIADQLSQKNDVVRGIIGFLSETGRVIRIGENLALHRETIDQVTSRVREKTGETIDVAWVKKTFGLTRRVAIPLLEYLDGSGVTVRSGDQRRVL